MCSACARSWSHCKPALIFLRRLIFPCKYNSIVSQPPSTNQFSVIPTNNNQNLSYIIQILDSNCCERCCFEGNREYNLSLVQGEEVVARIRKPYRVSRFCCYSNSVRIESPEDNPIGHIRQMFTLFGHPRYAIYDCQQPPKTPSFYIESVSCRFCFTPCLCTSICGNKEFRIVCVETKEEAGTISRHWSDGGADSSVEAGATEGAAAEEPFGGSGGGGASGGGQSFGITFASNLEARHKVLLLSSCFMMDFFYFENDRRRRKLASC